MYAPAQIFEDAQGELWVFYIDFNMLLYVFTSAHRFSVVVIYFYKFLYVFIFYICVVSVDKLF